MTSRLDYSNALLCGVNNTVINRLQRVQNAAARVITKTKKHEHITPILRTLHWLPVKFRIDYKIILYTFKILNGLTAEYLQELVNLYQPARSLRSQSSMLLCVPRARTRTYGNKRFDVAAASLWNTLPVTLRCSSSLACFKRELKTFLFRQAYL